MIRDFLNDEDLPAAIRLRPVEETTCCNLRVVDGLPVGMTYAPMQTYAELYEPEAGLCAGTIFKALDLPFRGRSGK